MIQNLTSLVNCLPSELLKDRETFNNIINREIIDQLPQSKLDSILNKYLPANLSNEDKRRTIDDLFDNKLDFLNINQMDNFYRQAKIHKFTPDLVKHLNELKLLKKKASRLEEKKFQCKLLNEIIIKKRLLIQKVLSLPPDRKNGSINSTNEKTEIIQRVNKRFEKELDEINLNYDLNENPIQMVNNNESNEEEKILINYSVDDQEYVKMLKSFKRKKSKNEINGDDFKDLSIKLVFDRCLENPSSNFESLLTEQSKSFKKKKKVVKKLPNSKQKDSSNNITNHEKSDPTVKQKRTITTSNNQQEIINKIIPELSTNGSIENHEFSPVYSSFFSLIRDVFYDNEQSDYKLTLHKLEELIKKKLHDLDPKLAWQSELVQSAMNYLSSALIPPKNIPLVDYKEKNQQWQWVTNENCDSDDILIKLNDWTNELSKYSLLDPSHSVPPSICKTDWTVVESTPNEKEEYRRQEVTRYQNPNRSFTFNLHNYKSIVGPVKNCTSAKESSNISKHKEKTSLLKERPPFVTLLSLVRDSASRLPNGEGTRFDICSLLKDSQYLRDDISNEQISAIVSGAFNRLHYEKDPCVRYDMNQKKWIYLHRYRTEDYFNRLHQQQIEANLAKKSLQHKLNSSKRSSNNNNNNNNKLSSVINSSSLTSTNQITITPKIVKLDKRKEDVITNNDKNLEIKPTIQLNNKSSSLLALSTTNQATLTNQIKTVNLNQTKLIELSHESIEQDAIRSIDYPELKNINITTYQSNKLDEESSLAKKELNNKRKLNSPIVTTKKPVVHRPNIVRIKSKIEGENSKYETTFSNIKSDLINKSIKQKYQKQPPITKKLKTDHHPTNGQFISASNLTLPAIISSKSSLTSTNHKDESNKIIQQATNRINLPTNLILNSTNVPLILSSSNSNMNGFTPLTISKNGHQILIHTQNTTINKLISSPQNIQNIRILPLTANNLSKPIVAKKIDSSNLSTKPSTNLS